MQLPRLTLCLAALVVALLAVDSAAASQRIGRNASKVTLKVDRRGYAVVTYRSGGRLHHPIMWGAVNARPPHPTRRQVKFRIDYSGGWGAFRKRGAWRTIRNACRPYDGPRLPWFVRGCKAPDGSYWALQRFQRLLPGYGFRPWKWYQNDWELHLSHWTGELPRLEVYRDWVYSNRRHELFGRLTYQGWPVHGFGTSPIGVPLDTHGRLIFLDTLNSRYGRGWKRENSFVAGRPNGQFCYYFVPRPVPSYYPRQRRSPMAPGNGQAYRITAGGPGVTPFVSTVVPGIPRYNSSNPEHVQHEQSMNALRNAFANGARNCHQN